MDSERPVVVRFPVKSCNKIQNPYPIGAESKAKNPHMYIVVCDVTDLPENIPMETNPREQKLTTDVAKEIKETLLEGECFYFLNRGLLLSASFVSYDPSENMITIVFDNPEVHGNVDGGHTYKIILDSKKEILKGKEFVRIEILTDINELFTELACARNTSVQVKDKSIAALEHKFAMIQDAIKNEPYANKISYRENEIGKRIDITDILTILNMFNIELYSDALKIPMNSYTGKGSCVSRYIREFEENENDQSKNPYFKMKDIIVDILRLYDILEGNIEKFYTKAVPGGRLNNIKHIRESVNKGDFHTKFYEKETSYKWMPLGFLYPMLSGFRALIEEVNGKYRWKHDPFEILNTCGEKLVAAAFDDKDKDPHASAHVRSKWSNSYTEVELALEKIRKK